MGVEARIENLSILGFVNFSILDSLTGLALSRRHCFLPVYLLGKGLTDFHVVRRNLMILYVFAHMLLK